MRKIKKLQSLIGRWKPWILLTIVIVVLTLNIKVIKSHVNGDLFCNGCFDSIKIKASPNINVISTSKDKNPFPNHISFDKYLTITGTIRKIKGYLTIGIPSIKRIVGSEYLIRTLDSLISQLHPLHSDNVVIVVFLCDVLTTYNMEIEAELQQKYAQYLKSGFMQVIRVDKKAYPPLEGLKRNFNDEPTRVTWRSKQVVDFAIMFSYCHNISTFYLQIEDDVETSRNFYSSIKNYVDTQTRAGKWTMLEFSELGFIGKLFKSSDLDLLSNYLLMFYVEQPVDWLMTFFRLSMAQDKVLLRKPTLFQHFGIKSSFDYKKDNLLIDKYFETDEKPWQPNNPPAAIFSTMSAFETNTVELAYNSGSGFFWTNKVAKGNEIVVNFEKEHVLSMIAVETGTKKNQKDILHNGSLLIGNNSIHLNAQVKCLNLIPIATFKEGKAINMFEENSLKETNRKLLRQKVKCIVIRVDKDQSNWLIVNQIAVFVKL